MNIYFCRSVPTRLPFMPLVVMKPEHHQDKEIEDKTNEVLTKVSEAYKLQSELVTFYAYRKPADAENQ